MVQANFLREPQFSLRTQWERIFSLFSFRAFCSTWQGLSALPHTRVWQSSGWPCQQLQGCLALSDESVGNLVQYCIGFNLVQYCIGFNLVQYCTGFNLVQYCTGFNLVQYCFVLILKFFPELGQHPPGQTDLRRERLQGPRPDHPHPPCVALGQERGHAAWQLSVGFTFNVLVWYISFSSQMC